MGLDYRYLLFFERAAELDALLRLAALSARRGGEAVTLEVPVREAAGVAGAGGTPSFPYRTLTLPFAAWAGTPAQLWWDDPSPAWEFATVLAFEPDEAIERYQRDEPQRDERGRHAIGYIYLTVHRDMAGWASGVDRDVVLFEFGTTGSRMSALFSESESIRAAFTGLLRDSRGVCGVLDMEDSAILFWWQGRELEAELPTAELDLAEIGRFVP